MSEVVLKLLSIDFSLKDGQRSGQPIQDVDVQRKVIIGDDCHINVWKIA